MTVRVASIAKQRKAIGIGLVGPSHPADDHAPVEKDIAVGDKLPQRLQQRQRFVLGQAPTLDILRVKIAQRYIHPPIVDNTRNQRVKPQKLRALAQCLGFATAIRSSTSSHLTQIGLPGRFIIGTVGQFARLLRIHTAHVGQQVYRDEQGRVEMQVALRLQSRTWPRRISSRSPGNPSRTNFAKSSSPPDSRPPILAMSFVVPAATSGGSNETNLPSIVASSCQKAIIKFDTLARVQHRHRNSTSHSISHRYNSSNPVHRRRVPVQSHLPISNPPGKTVAFADRFKKRRETACRKHIASRTATWAFWYLR